MRHQNSVFHSLTKHVPGAKFEQIVEKYGADRLVRKLTTKRHFIALLYGQLSGSTSLREIVTGMASHETRLYHVGAAPVKRSTMSDANSTRPWQVFSELFAQMLPLGRCSASCSRRCCRRRIAGCGGQRQTRSG